MKNTLEKQGNAYTITVEVNAQDRDTFRQKALKSMQNEVKVPGFRPGHVPLHMVEKQIKPEYIEMAFVEEIINTSIQSLVKDHADIQFVGQPYEINQNDKGDTKFVTYKLDIFPEVELKNDNWKKLSIPAIDTMVDKNDVEQALSNLQRQYADYKDTDAIGKTTLVKASYRMLDKDGAELHKGSAFFGKEEYEESELLWGAVEGKAKGDVVEIDYKEDKLPHAVHYHPHGSEIAKKIKKLELKIVDIKETILPDLHDQATLDRLFQGADINDYDALVDKVKGVLIEQKEETGLQQAIETLLVEASKDMSVAIPETFIREEMSARIKQMGDKMGGEAGLQQYFAQIGEEKTNQLYDDLKKSARESLEKFFFLRKIVDLLEIADVKWENALDAERKIYAKLSQNAPATAKKSTAKKADKEDTEEKAPAKKKTTKKSEE